MSLHGLAIDLSTHCLAYAQELLNLENARSAEAAHLALRRIACLRDDLQANVNLRAIESLDPKLVLQIEHTRVLFDRFDREAFQTVLNSPYLDKLASWFGQELRHIALAKTAGGARPQSDEREATRRYLEIRRSLRLVLGSRLKDLEQHGGLSSADYATRKEAHSRKWSVYETFCPQIASAFEVLHRSRQKAAVASAMPDFRQLSASRSGRRKLDIVRLTALRRGGAPYIRDLLDHVYTVKASHLNTLSLKYFDEQIPVCNGFHDMEIDNIIGLCINQGMASILHDMSDGNRLQLKSKNGIPGDSFCTYVGADRLPVIFVDKSSNLLGWHTLFHELGHAYQIAASYKRAFTEFRYSRCPEVCELPAFSAQALLQLQIVEHGFFDMFTGSLDYLSDALQIVAYGFMVSDFEEQIYKERDLKVSGISGVWARSERQFLPRRDYSGVTFLDLGGGWSQQSLLFTAPGYYEGYAMAQYLVLHALARDQRDILQALLSVDGSYSVSDILVAYNVDLGPASIEETCRLLREMLAVRRARHTATLD